jgi:cytoskeletal protein RodZ
MSIIHRAIHHTRQKPIHHRKRVALAVSFLITFLLFAVWAVTLPARFANPAEPQPAAVTASSPAESVNQYNQSYNTIKSQVSSGSQMNQASVDEYNQESNGVIISDPAASSTDGY